MILSIAEYANRRDRVREGDSPGLSLGKAYWSLPIDGKSSTGRITLSTHNIEIEYLGEEPEPVSKIRKEFGNEMIPKTRLILRG